MHILVQVVAKLFVIITLVSVGLARPQHFGETNQVGDKDQETAVNTNMMAPGQLNDRELELIAQSLFQSQQPHALFPDWRENLIRVPVQMKRQSKLACYFNPVSCFKK